MKIETSRGIRGEALTTRGGLRYISCSLFLLAVVVAAVEAIASPRPNQELGRAGNTLPATIIVVTNTNDSGPGSLRNALAIANDGDTIDATGVSGTILLTSGELQVNHNVTINGPGAGNLAVNGNRTSRVFENFASNVAISGFTITNGFVFSDFGGGIFNHGGLTVSDCSIISNRAGEPEAYGGSGGGIASSGGTLTVTNSVISSNNVYGGGGGIWANGATVRITNSTINGNAGISGGGIVTNGQLTVMNSTISGNEANGGETTTAFGGGIIADGGTLTVTNSTISDNHAEGAVFGYGGGVYNSGGTLTVTNSTISGNVVNVGGGGGGGIYNSAGTLAVSNSTFSGNRGLRLRAAPYSTPHRRRSATLFSMPARLVERFSTMVVRSPPLDTTSLAITEAAS